MLSLLSMGEPRKSANHRRMPFDFGSGNGAKELAAHVAAVADAARKW
jgi:hypothetical protein